jgi:type IV pilus assembly protein PilE
MKTKQTGVTLMELMIVMVVVAILASIAIPSYRASVVRTNRTEAKVALQNAAASLERCLSRYNAYDHADCAIATQLAATYPTESGRYIVSATTLNAGQFTLAATPQDAQATDDAGCGTMTFTQASTRGRSGAKPITECWDR